MDAYNTAASWKRPYSSMQWAWVRALGVTPADYSDRGATYARRRRHGRKEIREAMRQRTGVRGL